MSAIKQRRYSVDEIDAMRGSLEFMRSFGGGSDVEDRLRTYMLNGTDPAELKTAANANFDRWQKNRHMIEEQDRLFRDAMATPKPPA